MANNQNVPQVIDPKTGRTKVSTGLGTPMPTPGMKSPQPVTGDMKSPQPVTGDMKSPQPVTGGINTPLPGAGAGAGDMKSPLPITASVMTPAQKNLYAVNPGHIRTQVNYNKPIG